MPAVALPALTPYLVTAGIGWIMYRRIRRSFGRQPWQPKRTVFRLVLMVVLLGMLLFGAAFLPGVAAGVAAGLAAACCWAGSRCSTRGWNGMRDCRPTCPIPGSAAS